MRAFILLGTAAALAGCTANAQDNGPRIARAFPVAGAFDRISLAGSPDVIVTVGGAASVRAEGDAATLDRLEIVNNGGELHIGVRDGSMFDWSSHEGAVIHVTLPALAGASVSGSGKIQADHVQGPRFAGQVSGSGDLQIASLTVDQSSFALNGSGDITAAGRTQQANVSVTGSGDLHLGQLEAANATLAVTGSGSIGIRATQAATIELHGSGDVNVAGPAHCTINKTGSGEVNCGGAAAPSGGGGTAD